MVVDNLEKEGIVERVVCENDRRASYVQLTEKGKRIFKKVFYQHAEYVEKLASVLSENEQEELGQLLKKLGIGLSGKP